MVTPLCGVTTTVIVVAPEATAMFEDVSPLATVRSPGLTMMLCVSGESAVGLTLTNVSENSTVQLYAVVAETKVMAQLGATTRLVSSLRVSMSQGPPEMEVNPAGHVVHTATEVPAPAGYCLFAAHFVHDPEPAFDHSCAPHRVQVPILLALVAGENVPAAHASHTLAFPADQ